MTILLGVAFALMPFVAIVGLLRLVDRIGWRREAERARQIELTDAIHGELGAAAAPWVRRRFGGGWVVTMKVPLDRPGTVAALLRITHRLFASTGEAGAKPVRIVLTPDAPPLLTSAGPSRPAGRRSAGSLAPALR